MKGLSLKELGGSCITPKVHNKRRDTDYDGYNDYNGWTIEDGYEN